MGAHGKPDNALPPADVHDCSPHAVAYSSQFDRVSGTPEHWRSISYEDTKEVRGWS